MHSIHVLTLRDTRLGLHSGKTFAKIVVSKSHESRLGLIVRMVREQ